MFMNIVLCEDKAERYKNRSINSALNRFNPKSAKVSLDKTI